MFIQYIITIFAAFALSRVLLRILRDKASVLNLLFWGGFWTIVMVVVWFPNLVGKLSQIFGVGRGIDVLVYLGILGLYYMIYRIYAHLQLMEERITKIVRELAKINARKK